MRRNDKQLPVILGLYKKQRKKSDYVTGGRVKQSNCFVYFEMGAKEIESNQTMTKIRAEEKISRKDEKTCVCVAISFDCDGQVQSKTMTQSSKKKVSASPTKKKEKESCLMDP